MKEEICLWLKNIERVHGAAPPDVIAFNFGLFESATGYQMYVVGAFEYDEQDDDWACIQPPQSPEAYYRLPDVLQDQPWESVLAECANVLRQLESEGKFKEIFRHAVAITTGFDEGDLVKIR